MTASYPRNFVSFTVKQDIIDDVAAAHVNSLQDEVTAIQRTLGINPQIDVGMFTPNVAQDFGTVGDRISAAMRNETTPVASLAAINVPMYDGRSPTDYVYTIAWPTVNTNQNALLSAAGQNTLYCPRTGQYRAVVNATLHGLNPTSGMTIHDTSQSSILCALQLNVSTIGAYIPARLETYYPNDGHIIRPSLSVAWEGMWVKGGFLQAKFTIQDSGIQYFDFNLGVSFVRDL